MERYGKPITPPDLNGYFVTHGTYVDVDDGVRDDLGWGSISSYDSQVVVSQTGGAGWPPNKDAIVKFAYTSPRTGKRVTHFCLVVDNTAGLIMDSWDGSVKPAGIYGTPVGWATYRNSAPQVVTPPPPPAALPYTIENISECVLVTNKDAKLWDLRQRSWPGMVNNPLGETPAGSQFKANAIAHQILGGSYYMPDLNVAEGYNVVDCDVYTAPAPPAPPVTPTPVAPLFSENTIDGIHFQALAAAPKQCWISRPEGAEKWSFKDVANWRDFKSVAHIPYGTEVFISGTAHHPIAPNGADYYMTSDDFGDFKKTGHVVNYLGFKPEDLSDRRPPALPAAPEPVSEPIITPEVVTAAETILDWQHTYEPFKGTEGVNYITTRDIVIKDLEGKELDKLLPRGAGVKAFGMVSKDGTKYYRLRLLSDTDFKLWYAIAMMDTETNTPNLLIKPKAAAPVGKKTVVRDSLELTAQRIEHTTSQFLDDIIPKWFSKNKHR